MTITQTQRPVPGDGGSQAQHPGRAGIDLTQVIALQAMAQSGGLPLLPTLGTEPGEPAPLLPAWLRTAARWTARKIAGLWRALPGPWWVKAPLIVVCLAIPGPLDELALIAFGAFLAYRKVRAAR